LGAFDNLSTKIQQNLLSFQDTQLWKYFPQLLMGVFVILVTTFMFPSTESFKFANLNIGDVYTGKELIAPFTFYINKNEEELERDRRVAAENVPPVFVLADSIDRKAIGAFDLFCQRLSSLATQRGQDSVKVKVLRDILSENSVILDQSYVPSLIDGAFFSKSLNKKDDPGAQWDQFRRELKRILIDVYAIGIFNVGNDKLPAYVTKVSIVRSNREELDPVHGHYNPDTYPGHVLDAVKDRFGDEEVAIRLGYPIIMAFVSPNLIFNEEETNQRIERAISKIPLSKGIVYENERIINTHERISKDALEKLHSLAATTAERNEHEGGFRFILPVLGRMLTIALGLSFLIIFLYTGRKHIFEDQKRMAMVFLVFMFVLSIAFIINSFEFNSNLKLLIPVSIAAMLLTIFFDSRVGFITCVSLSIILAALRGNDFDIMLISLFASTISIFAVREIQSRVWLIKGSLYISAAYFVAIGSIELLKDSDVVDLWNMWLYGLLNGIFSPIVAILMMVTFEYAFQVTTKTTLLELSDLNKPLLRQLAIRAPGSYHHSIMVGNLAEAAAEAIGGNALLARVASYYHDIGKMEKPEYFVENQRGGKNPHEKLAPSMSSLILINHVKRGLEIAEEYKLPQEIRDFIPQHHGTNLIKFFYTKAKESADEGEVSESNFRYPGPKPQTRESGIVMLADAVEAGTRSLKEPSMSRIRSMVTAFTNERLLDNELDECPLTIRDLKVINESFVNILAGMYHGRIEYPGQEKRGFTKKKRRA
jgi:putative nucleotidyltransferase with HDIG domain